MKLLFGGNIYRKPAGLGSLINFSFSQFKSPHLSVCNYLSIKIYTISEIFKNNRIIYIKLIRKFNNLYLNF